MIAYMCLISHNLPKEVYDINKVLIRVNCSILHFILWIIDENFKNGSKFIATFFNSLYRISLLFYKTFQYHFYWLGKLIIFIDDSYRYKYLEFFFQNFSQEIF